ncbi:hypothetical protein R1flu_019687 [Riccia fluitans]|uniref:Secreted protein n=1 Tax=Riccia fluitans TaxID=41844 RepID=A0ABD1ZN77_9MARC
MRVLREFILCRLYHQACVCALLPWGHLSSSPALPSSSASATTAPSVTARSDQGIWNEGFILGVQRQGIGLKGSWIAREQILLLILGGPLLSPEPLVEAGNGE